MIEVDRVTKIFTSGNPFKIDQGKKALDEVSLTVPEGCVYGLLGTNGAGKSTLLRTMCGIYRPDEGSVTVDGREVWNNPEAKADVCLIGDEFAWLEKMSANRLKAYYRCTRPGFSGEVFDRLLEALALPKNRKLSTFSKGMRRQAVTALGVACRAKYLLLDEAFDGLDPAMRRVVREILADEVCDNGASVVLSSHDVTEISESCDHVVIMYAGKILQFGEIDEVCDRYRKIQLVSEGKVITREELANAGLSVLGYSVMGNAAQVLVRGTEEEITAKTAALPVSLTDAVPLTLEEVFVCEMKENGYGIYIKEE